VETAPANDLATLATTLARIARDYGREDIAASVQDAVDRTNLLVTVIVVLGVNC
jgi:hypothetical protein